MKVYLTFMGIRILKIYEDNTRRRSYCHESSAQPRPIWSQYGSTRKKRRNGGVYGVNS